MGIFNHSLPSLNINDILVIEFRDFEAQAYIMVKSLTSDTRFTLESYFDINGTLNAPLATANFTMSVNGEARKIDIPNSGNAQHRVTRMLITRGRVALDITSPTVCRFYIEQPINPPRIGSESRAGFA